MIENILEAVKEWRPRIISSSCEEYPTLKNGDYVIWFSNELALVYENGKSQILFNDWIGDFDDPLPTLLMILNGNFYDIYVESIHDSVLVLKDDNNRTPLETDQNYSEDSYYIGGILH